MRNKGQIKDKIDSRTKKKTPQWLYKAIQELCMLVTRTGIEMTSLLFSIYGNVPQIPILCGFLKIKFCNQMRF